MEKEKVDKIIGKYLEKLYGFALTKTKSLERAEELASRIVFDVYKSLLKKDELENIDGYVYKIAQNVYARYVSELVKGQQLITNMAFEFDDRYFDVDDEIEKDFTRLRKEITYLGKIQREIIVMYYFNKLKVNDIAKKLNLLPGTVKWHLFEARNQLKEKITMSIGENNGLKLIKFANFGYSGECDSEGQGPDRYLSKLMTQNILYAIYHEAKTTSEIAGELGVPAAFVEDELESLVANDFAEKVAGNRYQSIIYIMNDTVEVLEFIHKTTSEFAAVVCEKHLPTIIEFANDLYSQQKFYSPENDFNFLIWSLITYATRIIYAPPTEVYTELSKFQVERKDGGKYIPFANLVNIWNLKDLSYNPGLYYVNGDMSSHGYDLNGENLPVSFWRLDTCYDSRSRNGQREENIFSDYKIWYEYLKGIITATPEHLEKFQRLYEKGFLIQKEDSEYVNMVVTTMTATDLFHQLPKVQDEIMKQADEVSKKIYEFSKELYPKRLHTLHKAWCDSVVISSTLRPRILEKLYLSSVLKPLTENQQKTVNIMLFCDVLPK